MSGHKFASFRNNAGTATAIGIPQDMALQPAGGTGYTLGFTPSGANVQITITGPGGETFDTTIYLFTYPSLL
jgi:hypothetical protein